MKDFAEIAFHLSGVVVAVAIVAAIVRDILK